MKENNDKIKVINPLMLIVMIDDAKLITKNPLTFEEMKLFGWKNLCGILLSFM